MDCLHTESVDKLFEAILNLQNADDCYKFFEDICTVKELFDIAQRFEVASRLNEGKNYSEITAKTGASTATISRVNKCLMYGNGGYKLALGKLMSNEEKK